jgi:hypothetical protein
MQLESKVSNLPRRSRSLVAVPPFAALGFLLVTTACSGPGDLTGIERYGESVYPTTAVPVAVTLDASLCAAPDRPLWVAFQDDAGTWKQLSSVAGTYTASMLGAKGALAIVSGSTPNHRTTLFMWTRAELSAAPLAWCGAPVSRTRTATVNVAGMGEAESVKLEFGGGFGYAFANGVATIDGIEGGTHDFIAFRRKYLDSDRSGDRILIRRDLNPAAGASIGSINMTQSEALPLAQATFTVPSMLPGERLSFLSWFHFEASCVGYLVEQATVGETEEGGTTSFTARGVPAALRRPTDYHNMTLSAYRGTTSRYSEEMVGTFGPKTLSLPSSLPAYTVDLVPGAHIRPRVQIAMPAEFRYLSLDYSQSGAPDVSVLASAGWYGAGTVSLAVPDFSAAPGWNNVWLQPGTASGVYVAGIATNRSGPESGWCTEGSYTRIASSSSGGGQAALRTEGEERKRPEMMRRFFPGG